MRRRSSAWLWALPLALLGGCLLPEFENVPAKATAEGGSPSGGAEPGPASGAGGEGASVDVGGAGAGNGPPPAPPEPADDSFVVEQGRTLKVSAANGVLANDQGTGLRVTDFEALADGRPAPYDAEVVVGADGAVTFTPAGDFFGRYRVRYTVATDDEQTATAQVTFVVQPVAASLDAVADGVGGLVLTGNDGDELGASIARVGDVNADGVDDFALGAPGAGGGAGSVYVVFGRRDLEGFQLGPLAPASVDARFAVLTGTATERVGRYVAAAGLYDADAVPDILVGSPSGGRQDPQDGALYLVFGGEQLKATLALGAMPEGRGVVIEGQPFFNQRLGTLVAGGGDFDGDGQLDLLTGLYELGDAVRGVGLLVEAPREDTTIDLIAHQTMTETTYVLPLSLCFAGDVTGDGKDDILASSRASIALLPGNGSGELPAELTAVSPDGTQYGYRSSRATSSSLAAPLAPAGDVNGDGKADLVYCDGDDQAVDCPVLFGDLAVGRTLDDADWTVTGFATPPALPFVSPAADVNQDDFSDLLFAEETAAYVVFGRDAGFGAVDVGSLGDDGFSLSAPRGGRIGALAAIGDVNADGYQDFAVADSTAAGGAGRVYVVLGGPYSAEQR